MAVSSTIELTSVRRTSMSGASATTLMVSATPAGCILMSTGTVCPTWTRMLATGLAVKPLSVALTS